MDKKDSKSPAMSWLSFWHPHHSSYQSFYQEQDYPVEKYLREPLYFEVVLESTDSHLELVLENCWATLTEDRTSLPSWDIIIDG